MNTNDDDLVHIASKSLKCKKCHKPSNLNLVIATQDDEQRQAVMKEIGAYEDNDIISFICDDCSANFENRSAEEMRKGRETFEK
jgi:hypothetical protein